VIDVLLVEIVTFGVELARVRIVEEFRGYTIAVFGTKKPETLPKDFRRSDSFCETLLLTSGKTGLSITFSSINDLAFLNSKHIFCKKSIDLTLKRC